MSTGCVDRTPTGQVIATVDGEDVTLRDLAAEVAATGGAGGAAEVRGPLAQAVVDRRLFAQEARERGIDRSSDYLARLRRLREMLLADMLVERLALEQQPPSTGQIADFIARNPQSFAKRQLIDVTHSASGGNSDSRIDTAALPPEQAQLLFDAPIGVPITLPTQNASYRIIVRQRTPAPVTGDAAMRQAVDALRKKQLDITVEQFLTKKRNNAEIRYQDGFGTPTS